MGRWGHRVFESDGALDWSGCFVESPQASTIDQTACDVLNATGAPDADMCDALLAASSVLIAHLGSRTELPPDLRASLAAVRFKATSARRRLFVRALLRILVYSESQQLAQEEGRLQPWRRLVGRLIRCLDE
jgi:hypothetical protein